MDILFFLYYKSCQIKMQVKTEHSLLVLRSVLRVKEARRSAFYGADEDALDEILLYEGIYADDGKGGDHDGRILNQF